LIECGSAPEADIGASRQADSGTLAAEDRMGFVAGGHGGRLNRALSDTELADIEQPASADRFGLLEPEPIPG
jgi:hypothetical protein